MKSKPEQLSGAPRGSAKRVCAVCGKSAERTICDTCCERLRLDALIRKKHEEQGNAWSHWE